MTDKQITIDYKTICENYSKEIGCCNTFDGSCSKEECFTYRLLQLLKAKEQECEELKKCLLQVQNASISLNKQLDQLTVEKAKLEAQIEADTQYHVKEECNLRKIIRNKEKRNVELHKENNQLKALKEQAEQKLERIGKLCDRKTNQSSFCNGIENKDIQKLAIRILKIKDEVE